MDRDEENTALFKGCYGLTAFVSLEVGQQIGASSPLFQYSTNQCPFQSISRASQRHKNIKEISTRRSRLNSPVNPFISNNPLPLFHAKHMSRMRRNTKRIPTIPLQLLMPLHQRQAPLQLALPDLPRQLMFSIS